MQMVSSVLENPVWRWWLQKQCVFDDIFPWRTQTHPPPQPLSHTHTHTHSHTHSSTQTQLRWLKLWLPEAAIAVNQALVSTSVQSRQIDRKAWCHQFRKKKQRASLFRSQDVTPPQRERLFYVKSRQRATTQVFVRDKTKTPSPTFPVSPDKREKKVPEQKERGREEGGK